MLQKLTQIRRLVEVDLWRVKLKSLPKGKRLSYSFLRVIIISIKEFINDKCSEKASALTYLSMLSLVPVLAMIFGIAKVFGIRELMEKELQRYFSGQTEILNQVQPYVDKMLNTASGGIVAGVSAVFLIYTVIRLLMNIEEAFNDMWDIKKSRRWERKISDYALTEHQVPPSKSIFRHKRLNYTRSEFQITHTRKGAGAVSVLILLTQTNVLD